MQECYLHSQKYINSYLQVSPSALLMSPERQNDSKHKSNSCFSFLPVFVCHIFILPLIHQTYNMSTPKRPQYPRLRPRTDRIANPPYDRCKYTPLYWQSHGVIFTIYQIMESWSQQHVHFLFVLLHCESEIWGAFCQVRLDPAHTVQDNVITVKNTVYE